MTVDDQLRQYGRTRVAEPRPCAYCESGQHRKNDYQDRTSARRITDEGFEMATVVNSSDIYKWTA